MKKEARHIKSALESLLQRWERHTLGRQKEVIKAWQSAIEDAAKKHTRPITLKKGVLMVIVESPAWLYKLTLEKRNILKTFNENYNGRNKAKDIRFRIGILDE